MSLYSNDESIKTIAEKITTNIPTPTYPMLTADTRLSSALVSFRILEERFETFMVRLRFISSILSFEMQNKCYKLKKKCSSKDIFHE
jgi:hypothetical protein